MRIKDISILDDVLCSVCNSPVIDVCTNGDFFASSEMFKHYDYVWYCANPTCSKHRGTGFDLNNGDPDWTKRHLNCKEARSENDKR